MVSPLDFNNTTVFRKQLLTRNLPPYKKSPNKPSPAVNYEYVQSDYSVIDSPDDLIDLPKFANILYPLNQWGAEGGYIQVPDVNILKNTKSNYGEYGPGQQDAKILEQALPESKNWKKLNAYGSGTDEVFDSGQYIMNPNYVPGTGLYNNQPYPNFVNSMYSPLSILLSPDPQGDNGLLSQDSFIIKLGAISLRHDFEERIATQIKKQTLDRANVFNANSATDYLNILTGRVPLLEPNWVITQPDNPILAATDFILRLGGSIIPISPIPGSYFDPSVNPRQPTTIQQLSNAFKRTDIGNIFTSLLGTNQSGTQIFYQNTGSGQRSRLFYNLDYNKYRPSYDRTLLNRLSGALVSSTTDSNNYYIGSLTSDPSRVFSPGGQLPIDSFGRELQSPVYGPSELAQLFEGPNQDIKLGANGPTYSDGGGIEGGFTWVSPKYKGNAGKKVGIGGQILSDDEDFRPSSYETTESTNREFRESSILDATQKLINSQPQGGKRLQHVGNAIDQVSKVFNDGYKELTKGSRVLKYVGEIGQEVGTEYCRVFAKDIPYLQYNDLQKQDGIVTNGRKFSWSVLDKTYNLNIAPNKQEGGQSSSNIIGNVSANDSYAKKYMFSLENLAWRSSNTPGLTVSDLPVCERGPNGGRVMWFPPYDLSFSETVQASWKTQDFIGRPEPVYTYSNTQRSGSISWKIVVDHPSVLNVIVNKVLNNETNKTRIDSILESFFAGCRKYDLYELAKKYYTVNPNDLKVLQKLITDKEVTTNELEYIVNTVQSGNDSLNNQNQPVATNLTLDSFKEKYQQIGLYFDNDHPKPKSTASYQTEYNIYVSPANIQYYKNESPSTADQTSAFFENVIIPNYKVVNQMIDELSLQLESINGNITIWLNASCSAPASESYNIKLANKRVNSVKQYFEEHPKLKKWVNDKLFIKQETVLGENATVKRFDPVTLTFSDTQTVNCGDNGVNVKGGDTQVGSKDIFTTNAMACRRAYISRIELPVLPADSPPDNVQIVAGNTVVKTRRIPQVEEKLVDRNNVTKWVLRSLLTECDYFETIKESSPMVYDNLKDKLKFFQPAFHSITPEGLNARLTFLQQCLRPGDTIPVVKEVGNTRTLQYNNAINTAFGTPPVLVLRIGDFYHTKIIPNSMNLEYENLDLNPEGIGVQPIIAKVTLSFNFVGGNGLKSSIDKLQNALTFNYYANTEIYDDRSDATDSSYKVLDTEFLNSLKPVQPPSVNDATVNNGRLNFNTVGDVLTKEIGEFETGTITYSNFMEQIKSQTQTYFQLIINKIKESNLQYNNAVRQQWFLERNYTTGHFSDDKDIVVPIFGKPSNIEKRFNEISKQYLRDIDDDKDPYIKFISSKNKNFSNKLIRQLKKNYYDYVKDKNLSYQTSLTKITQDLVNQEQLYINYLGKLNTITFQGNFPESGTDGFQQKNGTEVIYATSGTSNVDISSGGVSNTFQELINDFSKIKEGLINYQQLIVNNYDFVYSKNNQNYNGFITVDVSQNGKQAGDFKITSLDVFIPFNTNSYMIPDSDITLTFDNNNEFKRVYMFLSDDVLDTKKYETFKNRLIGNTLNNKSLIGSGRDNIEEVFDSFWKVHSLPIFKLENDITNEFLEFCEKNVLKDYIKYTPYEKKERLFTFTSDVGGDTTDNKSRRMLIKGLGSSNNLSSNTGTWNDNPSGTSELTFISKIKLN